MALREGYSTAKPPLFDGAHFGYWKGRMKYYLMNDIDLWFSIDEGYEEPRDEEGNLLSSKNLTKEKEKTNSNTIKRADTFFMEKTPQYHLYV